MSKKTTCHDEPIIVGFGTLNNAKQRMPEFKYDFIGRLLRSLTNRAIEIDTGSMTESTKNERMTAEACNI